MSNIVVVNHGSFFHKYFFFSTLKDGAIMQ